MSAPLADWRWRSQERLASWLPWRLRRYVHPFSRAMTRYVRQEQRGSARMELPAVGLVPERMRWKIWGLLTRSRHICPANAHSLLLWGSRRDPRVDSVCRTDCARNGSCWCGNLRTGQQGLTAPQENPA